jgi:hypothetical protein
MAAWRSGGEDKEDKMEPRQALRDGMSRGRASAQGGKAQLKPAQKQQKLETPTRATPLLDEAGEGARSTRRGSTLRAWADRRTETEGCQASKGRDAEGPMTWMTERGRRRR